MPLSQVFLSPPAAGPMRDSRARKAAPSIGAGHGAMPVRLHQDALHFGSHKKPPEKHPEFDHVGQQIAKALRSGRPDDAKAELVRRKALQLFDTCKGKSRDLIAQLKTLGLEIRQGEETPWVDTYLKSLGTSALLLFPDTLAYGHSSPPPADAPVELQRLIEQCETLGRPIMLVSDKVAENFDYAVHHEAFHFIQALCGLKLFGDAAETDEQADEAIKTLRTPGFPKTFSLLRPWVRFQIKTGRLSPPKTGVPLFMHTIAQRELENYRFLQKHGRKWIFDKDAFEDKYLAIAFYEKLLDYSYVCRS